MFVLDALRQLKDGRLVIPSFHLGHLGFRPGLEVDSYYGELTGGRGHELTLTPFQGSRDDIFILKCIFEEKAGVVAKVLSAFATMQLNILSLESATIDRDTKHVIFCILSWAPFSQYPRPVPLDDGTKYKFIDVLPLLPTLDKRYIYFLEAFFQFCFDGVEFEKVPGGKHDLPRINIKLFDDFYVQHNVRPLTILRRDAVPSSTDSPLTLPAVYVDLKNAHARRVPQLNARALIFSETETKALHVVFPKAGREKRFLHIGFTHENRPGALLLIASLLQLCGFSIKTSLLRQHNKEQETNVWEAVIEYVGEGQVESIPEGKQGVQWFRDWCFGEKNPHNALAKNLVSHLRSYKVDICRPSYPRRHSDVDEDFHPINWLNDVSVDGTPSIADDEMYRVHQRRSMDGVKFLNEAQDGHESRAWLAKLFHQALVDKLTKSGGTVFVSMPVHMKPYLDRIVAKFKAKLNLQAKAYLRADSADNLAARIIEKIREADYFLGIWSPEQGKGKDNELSPWMPFEFGVAKAFGKPCKIIAHRDIPIYLKDRIAKDYAMMDYDDDTFDEVISETIQACRVDWQPPSLEWMFGSRVSE